MRINEQLQQVDLFAALPSEVLYELVERGSKHRVGPGRTLVEQGSPDSGFQLILEGSAHVSVNGQPRGSLGPGDYFGEISLIDSAPRSATVVTGDEGAATFTISPLAFADLLDRHPTVARHLLPVITARLRRAEAAAHGG